MLKRVGDRRHPCLTPTVVLNHSPMLPLIWTILQTITSHQFPNKLRSMIKENAFRKLIISKSLETFYKASGPEVIKLFSCSTHLSMIFFLHINVKMPTIVGILTFMNMKNSIISLPEPKNAEFPVIFILMSIKDFHAQLN